MIKEIIQKIVVINPLHGKKVKKLLTKFDDEYIDRANSFLSRYDTILKKEGKTMDYAIECYLKMIADFNTETIGFLETGKYSSSSFKEVNKRVYDNPEIMEYYMHGLLLSQFLFHHHYSVLLYFNQLVRENSTQIENYLEIGGGHGLYISEAINIIGDKANYDLVDISESSLKLAKTMIENERVNYFHSDIFDFKPTKKYDFIVLGEVLEHLEEPLKLLKLLKGFLSDKGTLFITVPTNAPAIDHIYLFKDDNEIRQLISDSGFKIVDELCIFAEDLPKEICERYKISMLYAGLLTN